MPRLSILTPSFNKHEYVLEAIDSVLKQTFTDYEYWLIENSTDRHTRNLVKTKAATDPRLHYLEIDFSDNERASIYIPAYIANQFLKDITTPYFIYLSDDDMLHPSCLEKAITLLESDAQKHVCYFSMDRIFYRSGKWIKDGGIYTSGEMGKGTKHPKLDCVLDGGQILHRTSCLNVLPYPYFPEVMNSASHCDGLFLDNLAQQFTFYPVLAEGPLLYHRHTPKSTWSKP